MTDVIKLLDNEPLETLIDQDLFSLLPKANAIQDILEKHIINDNKIKMVALYGSWGSGKTSIMLHLKNALNGYKPIFFEAWKLENDNNLALSLLEQIADEQVAAEPLRHELVKAGRTILSFGKNALLNTNINILGIGLALGKSGKDTIEEVLSLYQKESFYSQLKLFQEKFQELEKHYIKNGKRIIVFIDDIDRCEPENILTLLSSIKLFFTHGSNILYFCGLDQEAINKAVEIKYKDVVKSDEYLEKIFDLSFYMPESVDLKKLLTICFPSKSDDFASQINEFLVDIEFTNPRHIKKVMNKYTLLKQLKKNKADLMIPDIAEQEHILTTVFVMFTIILYEFFPKNFKEVYYYRKKISTYINNPRIIPNSSRSETLRVENKEYFSKLSDFIPNLMISRDTFLSTDWGPDKDNFMNLFHIFTPEIKKDYVKEINPDKFLNYLTQFEDLTDSMILINFCRFLDNLRKSISSSKIEIETLNSFRVFDLFNMARLYL